MAKAKGFYKDQQGRTRPITGRCRKIKVRRVSNVRVRQGQKFYKGDDLTKTKEDAKLVGAKYESWEKPASERKQ